MKDSIKKGFNFGLTSGIITTLGLIVGLANATSRNIIILGILTIAFADAFSDALGIHISEESEKKNKNTTKQIWESTAATYFAKLFFASLFIIPFLFFEIKISVIIGIAYGAILLTISSYHLAIQRKIKPWKTITEHLGIAVVVVIISNFIGKYLAQLF